MRIASLICSSFLLFFSFCNNPGTVTETSPEFKPEPILTKVGILPVETDDPVSINTGGTTPKELINYAGSLTGIPYKYGSSDPRHGFDCSGFITYVFNHFNIAVPRSSIDFTAVKREIELKNAKPGDLILFTGTDSTIRAVGHMGIITSNTGEGVKFIHATSGKTYGVTTTPLNAYYQGRFVKALRIFKQNDIR